MFTRSFPYYKQKYMVYNLKKFHSSNPLIWKQCKNSWNFHTVNDSIWTPCILIHLYTYSKKHDITIDKLPIKFSSEKNPWFSPVNFHNFLCEYGCNYFHLSVQKYVFLFLQISPFLSDLLWHIGITYHEKRQQNVDKDISYKNFLSQEWNTCHIILKKVAVFEFLIKDKSIYTHVRFLCEKYLFISTLWHI